MCPVISTNFMIMYMSFSDFELYKEFMLSKFIKAKDSEK